MSTQFREQIMKELEGIPEAQLKELLGVIHYYKLGLQSATNQLPEKEPLALDFAGIWSDMTEAEFDELLELYSQRSAYWKERNLNV